MNTAFPVMDKNYVEEHLTAKKCVELMEDTLIKENKGLIKQPLRTGHPLQPKGLIAFMPGYTMDGYFGCKLLSVFKDNYKDGFPSHQGQVVLFESDHGQMICMADATAVTKIRTGAASAAATKALANPDSKVLTLMGTGEQAESHLKAIAECYDLSEIRVWNRSMEKAEKFCEEMAAFKKNAQLIPCCDAKKACENADIICTLTSAAEPILTLDMVKPGAHINAVGSCSFDKREIDSALVKASRFFSDNMTSVMAEAGDLLIPIKEGVVTKEHCLGTVGQVLCKEIEGRTGKDDITVFESQGIAAEDLASTWYLYQNYNK